MGLVCPSQKGKLDPFCWRGGSNFGLQKGKLDPFCWRGGSNFGLQKGKLDTFAGGVSNEGLLDLSRVDLVFFWIESRHFRQNRLVLCGLRLFCWICRQTGCGLRLFHSDFRLVSCGLRLFCLIVGKRGCGLSLFFRHFRLPAWSLEGGGEALLVSGRAVWPHFAGGGRCSK